MLLTLDLLPEFIPNQRLIVAYSGGLDSHVLLHALAQLRNSMAQPFRLEALHVHHGVSDQADSWVSHCQSICQSLEVPLTVRYVINREPRASLENQLREARYKFFADCVDEGDQLVLAHHADDQAETLLFRLLRGSGPQGLAGIPAQRRLNKGTLIRPLLGFTREELEAYAQQQGLRWVEDASNADARFDRNFLRLEVMPKLAERWPNYLDNFSRSAQVLGESAQALDYFLERELSPVLAEHKGGVEINWLQQFERGLQINLLRGWLKMLRLTLPAFGQLHQILDEVMGAREDAQPLLRWPGVEVRRFGGVLYALEALPKHDADGVFEWSFTEPLDLPGAGRLTVTRCEGAGIIVPDNARVRVCFRQGGERCRLAGHKHSRLLKKLLNEWQVPPWLRARVPLLYLDGELAAVADLGVCDGFQATQGQIGCRLEWQRP